MQVLHRPGGVVRFGPFELDLRAGELRKQGLKTKLQQQPAICGNPAASWVPFHRTC